MEEKIKTITLFVDNSDSSKRVLKAFKGLEELVLIIHTEPERCADFTPPKMIGDVGDALTTPEQLIKWANNKKKELAGGK